MNVTPKPAVTPWIAGAQWLHMAEQAWWMWAEAASVIAMRSTMIAFERPGHAREAQRMVTEKFATAISLTQRLATMPPFSPEQAAHMVLSVYSPRVSANRRRLARRFARD